MKTRPTTMALVALLTLPAWTGEDKRERKAPPVPLPRRERPEMERAPRRHEQNQQQPAPEFAFPPEIRAIDGYGNNLANPEAGTPGQPMLRLFRPDYEDVSSEPAGADRSSAREISNAVVAQASDLPNQRGATDYLWQWGQFLDHDITETPTADPEEAFDIPVPSGDAWFDPARTGNVVIAMNRSHGVMINGIRQQVNEITAFIDASNVYGSDEVRSYALRRLDGSGELKTSSSDHGPLLPYNDGGHVNAPDGSPSWFLAGDVRANEQAGLTAMHTLFVREHNYWARSFREENPGAAEDEVFEFARMIVAAEMQHITYREFLPVLLGPGALRPYQGYRADVAPGIANEFATAAFRFGHSLLPATLLRLDAEGEPIEAGNLELADAFFNPSLVEDHGIDPLLRGLAAQECQELDDRLVDGVRNFLFGPPGAGGFDLASLNIQRGRDHGLPSYNEARRQLGLPPARRFADVHPDHAVQARLEEVYDTVDNIDLWVGGLCEPHLPDSMVGPVFHRILIDQFTRLRDGDRFWHEGSLPPRLLELVRDQSLARIIRRNTTIADELQEDVFLLAATESAETPRRPGRSRTERQRR